MEVDFVGFDGGLVGQKVGIDDALFCAPYRPDLISLVINWQLAKRRSGTHSAKGVSDVRGTTRKPYKQKGTGRARQGSLRSTQFRGGGVAFGPVVRSHAFCVNKKVRNFALKSALSLKTSQNALFVLKESKFPSCKTSDFVKWVKDSKIFASNSSALIVLPEKDYNLSMSVSNLHKIKVLYNDAVNVYDLLTHDFVLLEQRSVKNLESRLLS